MAVFEFLSAVAYCLLGVAIAVLQLPWRDTEWRNVFSLEYWAVNAIFWPYILLAHIWVVFRRFLNVWTDYRARRRYLRSGK